MHTGVVIEQAMALLLALFAVAVINKAGPKALNRLGFTIPGQSATLTNADLTAFLGWSFAAGLCGAFVIGAVAHPLHIAPVLAFLGIGLVLNGLALLNTLSGFPTWFKVVFIGTLPIQVSLGVTLGRSLY